MAFKSLLHQKLLRSSTTAFEEWVSIKWKKTKKKERKENNGTSALEALCRIDAAFYLVIHNKQVTVTTCSDPVVQFEQKKIGQQGAL